MHNCTCMHESLTHLKQGQNVSCSPWVIDMDMAVDGNCSHQTTDSYDHQVPEVASLEKENQLHWIGQQMEKKQSDNFQHEQDAHSKLMIPIAEM